MHETEDKDIINSVSHSHMLEHLQYFSGCSGC